MVDGDPPNMELRFQISDAVMQGLQERTDTPRPTDLARDAIDLLNWATNEVSAGRRVVSIDEAGHTCTPLMDVLTRAQY